MEAFWIVLIVVSFVGLGACLYLYQGPKGGLAKLRKLNEKFESLDMRLRYTPEDAFSQFESVGAEGRELLMRQWRLDYGIVAGLLGVMIAATHNVATISALATVMYALAAGRAAADILENLLLSRLCSRYPESKLKRLARAAGYVTSAKWLMMGLWALGLFINLCVGAAGMF